jgi:arylsulfatase A-like enzyme
VHASENSKKILRRSQQQKNQSTGKTGNTPHIIQELRMNIILIVSDTFRRDHLPCYGNSGIISPHLDSFASKALIFENGYPASFPTVPTRADLLTGRFTFTYLPWGPLPLDEVTLPECLNKVGYATAAVVDTPFFIRNGYGQDRGFKEFIYVRGQLAGTQREYLHLQRPFSEERGYCAAKTFKEASDWLQCHYQEKFFLYVDTWDPHEPWDPPAYYVTPYLPDYNGEVVSPNYWDYQEDGYSERDMEIARACYKGEISMVDHWFGYFMERLRVLNLIDDTAIFFTSDHGFCFGEHGLFGKRRFRWADGSDFEEGFAKGLTLDRGIVHRSPLHNEITQVPLLVYLPGQEHKRIPGLVSLPDLMPTILELAGAETPDRVQAKSIMPLIRGETSALHDFVVTSAPFTDVGQMTKTVDDFSREVVEVSPSSITNGEWDLLYAVYGQPVELYLTKDDPGHQNDLFFEHPEVARALHAQFAAWLDKLEVSEKNLESRKNL